MENEVESVDVQSIREFAESINDLPIHVLTVMKEVINVELSARTEN